jgi:hypothetical protein
MIGELRMRELVVVGAAVGSGLVGTAVALGSRGADEQFLQDQRNPARLRPADVERVVSSAPDPATGTGRGLAATCTSRGSGPLGNPWSCVVRYPSGKRVRIAVRVQQDGYYSGRYAGGGGATGCCIDLPGTR